MKKVLLLFGGKSSEHEVSCLSGKSILENIDYKKFHVTSVGITEDNEWLLYDDDISYLVDRNWKNHNVIPIENISVFLKNFDVVFPIIHGNTGEDGKLQGLLDFLEISYVGSKTLSSALGMDKAFSKMVFDSLHIPQVPYVTLQKKNFSISDIENKIRYPMIVKPANGGSSIGISKANTRKELLRSIKLAQQYDLKVVVEEFIVAHELECAVLENKHLVVSQIGEILSCNEFYDYEAKYVNASQTIIPADLPKEITTQIQEYAKQAFLGIEAKGLARVDFFYDSVTDKIYLNEINTLPGFTKISMYPKLLTDSKFSYSDLITTLILHA